MTRRIIHAQTVIFEEDLKRLKELTGESSTKDAIAKAVYFFICFFKSFKGSEIKTAEPTMEGMQQVVDSLIDE